MFSLKRSAYELVAKNYKPGSQTGCMSLTFGFMCGAFKLVAARSYSNRLYEWNT